MIEWGYELQGVGTQKGEDLSLLGPVRLQKVTQGFGQGSWRLVSLRLHSELSWQLQVTFPVGSTCSESKWDGLLPPSAGTAMCIKSLRESANKVNLSWTRGALSELASAPPFRRGWEEGSLRMEADGFHTTLLRSLKKCALIFATLLPGVQNVRETDASVQWPVITTPSSPWSFCLAELIPWTITPHGELGKGTRWTSPAQINFELLSEAFMALSPMVSWWSSPLSGFYAILTLSIDSTSPLSPSCFLVPSAPPKLPKTACHPSLWGQPL